MRIQCLAQAHNTMSLATDLEPGPLDPELSPLTMGHCTSLYTMDTTEQTRAYSVLSISHFCALSEMIISTTTYMHYNLNIFMQGNF